MKRLCLIKDYLPDSHLTKDTCILPYVLYKHYGYDVTIATFKLGEYPSLSRYLDGIQMHFIEPTGDQIRDMETYLRQNAENIDILYMYGFYGYYYSLADIYKNTNSEGKLYLKLDANLNWMRNIALDESTLGFMQGFDLISAECREIRDYLNRNWPCSVEYIPNGFYDFYPHERVQYGEKENVILTVGRIGTPQKANEVLLEAFRGAADRIPGWKLRLVGTVEEGFKTYLQDYFTRNPDLVGRVEFPGSIDDKQVLAQEYSKAKVFCLTSWWEGFPNVFAEAGRNGCHIVSSNLESARDFTDYGRYGTLFEPGNTHQLAEILVQVCNDEEFLGTGCEEMQHYVEENFDWIKLCGKLDQWLTE